MSKKYIQGGDVGIKILVSKTVLMDGDYDWVEGGTRSVVELI